MSQLRNTPRWPERLVPPPVEARVARPAALSEISALVIVVGVIGAIWVLRSGATWSWLERVLGPLVVFVETFLRSLTGIPVGVPS